MASSTASGSAVMLTPTVIAPPVARKSQTQFSSNLFLGGTSGMVGLFAVYPIDLAKTKIQNQSGSHSTATVIRTVLRSDGILGLYRGLSTQLIAAAPEKAMFLASRDMFKSILGNDNSPRTVVGSAICAGALQSTMMNPVEAVKVRLQLSRGSARIPQVISSMGLRGLYKGYTACLPRDISFASVYFSLFEVLKYKMGPDAETFYGKLACGVAAGIPAATVTTPLDLIKTRLQSPDRLPSSTFRSIVKDIVAEDGVRGLMRGVGPRVGRLAPQYGIVLMTYEWLQGTLAKLAL